MEKTEIIKALELVQNDINSQTSEIDFWHELKNQANDNDLNPEVVEKIITERAANLVQSERLQDLLNGLLDHA